MSGLAPSAARRVLALYERSVPGIATAPLVVVPHAVVAFVWFVGDSHVLRAREIDGAGGEADFAAEQELLERARALFPWRLPVPLPAGDDAPYVISGGLLWTLCERLPGEILSPRRAPERLDDGLARRLVGLLRTFHAYTCGRLGKGDPGRVVREARANLALAAGELTPPQRARLEVARVRVMSAALSFEAAQLALVHGDFHYGNLLIDGDAKLTGVIDLHRCRVGHPLEDLGYTAMMLMRGSTRGKGGEGLCSSLRDTIYDWYSGEDGLTAGRRLYHEYVLLAALSDLVLFKRAANLPQREPHVAAQLELLSKLATKA